MKKTATTDRTEGLAEADVISAGAAVARRADALPVGEQIEMEALERPRADPATKTGGRPPLKLIGFVATVLLPFLACLLYFVFVAADQYTAEARFAVRSLADEESDTDVDTGLLRMRPAAQDAYVVTSFIHSAEILKRIGTRIDYRSVFVRGGGDFYAEFDADGSAEAFLTYWKSQVTAYIDGPSGIITLKVRTFRPEDSVAIANAIIEESEKLINELSERSRNDMIAGAKAEVERAGKAYGDTLAALNRFQQESGILNPQNQALETGGLLTGLLAQKLELDSRLFVVQQSNGTDSPTYRQLVLARNSLEGQIEELRGKLTGTENTSFANALLEFSRLETDRMVAEKLYEVTRRHYEVSLAAAMRKALYLTVFVHPKLPEESLYPRRLATPLLILFGLFIFWSTLTLAWASVEDHRL